MSKTIIYQCDQCGKQLNVNKLLEISSDNRSLGIINNVEGAKLASMDKHSDLHFCSRKCLNEFLFLPLNSDFITKPENFK